MIKLIKERIFPDQYQSNIDGKTYTIRWHDGKQKYYVQIPCAKKVLWSDGPEDLMNKIDIELKKCYMNESFHLGLYPNESESDAEEDAYVIYMRGDIVSYRDIDRFLDGHSDLYKQLVMSYLDDFENNGVYESYKRLHEQDVEIEVKHEGILEVPEGKNVEDLPVSHFVNLAKKKGTGKITKALNNLQVWNKKKNPSLSKWAGDMIDKVNKKMEKKESLRKESYRYYSDLEGLDDTTLDIIRKLDELDYYGIKPIQFGKDTLMSFSKNYFTDEVKSNGVSVDIDPLNGDVTVTEFIYDVDGEDLTDLCPVKKVRTVNDVIKIDHWAKNIREW